MDIPCSMCLENPAGPHAQCANGSIYERKECDCCNECREACKEEWYSMIDSGEADQEVIDYFKEGPRR